MKRVGIIENSQFFPRGAREAYSSGDAMRVSGGNTGNVAFVHAIRTMIADEQFNVDWTTPVETINSNLDVLVICCANQLGDHVDLASWAERIGDLKIPVLLVGLGAQSVSFEVLPKLPQGTLHFLAEVKRLSGGVTAVTTRGDYTTGLLDQLNIPSISAGCPSVLISPDRTLGHTILEKRPDLKNRKIILCGGNPWHASSVIEPMLVDIISRSGGSYILQHPQLAFNYFFGEDEKVTDSAHEAMSHLLFGGYRDRQTVEAWIKKNSRFFLDAQDWMDFLRLSDAVIGARYHGVALGIQVGCAGTVFSIDSRTRELCESTGVPHIDYRSLIGLQFHDVVEMCDWNEQKAVSLDRSRKKNARLFVDFFAAHGLEVAHHIRAISE